MNPSGELILGVDGGGTKTVALLASVAAGDRFSVVGRGTAGPSNPQVVGFEKSIETIAAAIDGAFARAALPKNSVASACVALAGAGRPDDQQRLRDWAESSRRATRFFIATDAEAVLAAGSADRSGIALIAGTGSMAYGRDRTGRVARAGGWGYLYGDEGSAYYLAIGALRAVTQAADGRGAPTGLSGAILEALALDEPMQLTAAILGKGLERAQIAELARAVTRVAEAEDEVAITLVSQAGIDLAAMVIAVAKRLAFDGSFPLALGGGLIVGCERLRLDLLFELERNGVKPTPVVIVDEPAQGCLREALARLA